MILRIVGEAETDRHAGGMTQRAQQETVAETRDKLHGAISEAAAGTGVSEADGGGDEAEASGTVAESLSG